MSLSSIAVRIMLRPIRPNPLIHTLVAIHSSGANYSPAQPAQRTKPSRHPRHTLKFPAPPNPKCYGLHPQMSTQAPFGVRRLDAAFPPGRGREMLATAILQSHPTESNLASQ